MNMIYGVKDKPKFGQTLIFAIQQLLAIMAATLVVPVITNAATGSTLSPAAALFGAGVGTLVSMMMPYSIAFFISWSLFLLAWWGLGMPLGVAAPYTWSAG